MNDNKVIIFSHGFGVQKDDRGLFTDIAKSMPKINSIMFDYDVVDISNNTLTTRPIDEKADMLSKVVKQAQKDYPNTKIYLICHSQGCLVASLANLVGIDNIIFIAPPSDVDPERKIKKWSAREGAKINRVGMSSFLRRDGSTTLVPKQYWDSLEKLDTLALYGSLATQSNLYVLVADQDEVIGDVDFSNIKNIRKKHFNANHDFTGSSRHDLIKEIKSIINP